MKSIFFYISDLDKGGAQRVICTLSNLFSEKGYKITIVTTAFCTSAYQLNKEITHRTLDVSEFDTKKPFLWKNIIRNRRFVKLVKVYKPDVIITFLEREIYRVLSIKKILKVPIIVSFRNAPNMDYSTFIKRNLIKLLINRADGIVYQTQEAYQFFYKNYHNNHIIILNPINPKFLDVRLSPIKKKSIVTVGKLYPQKNHKLLIDSFNIISQEFPDYILEVYGEGSLRQTLQAQIELLRLEKRVFLRGITDSIENSIKNASLFVLSSNYEGISNALMEAMVLGLPVISTDCPCGGSSVLIRNRENGILVPTGNEVELANAIRELLSDQYLSKKLGQEASKLRDIVNPEKISVTWEEFINDVIA
nr:glycosyltransferase [uncultured Sphaerochaeta sp.]